MNHTIVTYIPQYVGHVSGTVNYRYIYLSYTSEDKALCNSSKLGRFAVTHQWKDNHLTPTVHNLLVYSSYRPTLNRLGGVVPNNVVSMII